MHESSIARRILFEVLDRAATEGVSRLVAVRGRVAESENLSNGSLAFHFAAHAVGTIAEGAVLELEITTVHVRCDACGTTYVPEHHLRICPTCNSSEGRLTGEEGIWIDSVDVR